MLQQRWAWNAVQLQPQHEVITCPAAFPNSDLQKEIKALWFRLRHFHLDYYRVRSMVDPFSEETVQVWGIAPRYMPQVQLREGWTLSCNNFPEPCTTQPNNVVLDDMATQHLGYLPVFVREYVQLRAFVWIKRVRVRSVVRALSSWLAPEIVHMICTYYLHGIRPCCEDNFVPTSDAYKNASMLLPRADRACFGHGFSLLNRELEGYSI